MKKMGYILIALGAILLVSGILVLQKKPQATTTPQPVAKETPDARFEENKAKGEAFEAYVVQLFDKQYFTLQEWRGDKYVEGNYPVSNHFPDLEVIFKHKGQEDHFAIECKWRQNYFKDAIEWAHGYQVNNYQRYAQKTGMPVYVVIGVGGQPSKPEEVFLIPLEEIKYQTLYKSTLEPYSRTVDNDFFWDSDTKKLM